MERLQFSLEVRDTEKKLLPLINDQTNVYKVEKCTKSSMDIRNEGNKLYNLSRHNKKIHLQTLMCYTKCIAHAPSGSEELAKGYSNRSMLLFHLEQYKSCIADIDQALLITKLNWLRIKLLARKVECMILGQLYLYNEYQSLDIEKILNEAKDLVNKVEGDKIKIKDDLNMLIINAEELVKKLYNKEAAPSKNDGKLIPRQLLGKAQFPDFDTKGEIPCASDALALKYNDEFGRHLTATREIKAGEILMIEDGFVHPNPINAYMTCSHCLEGTYNPIPCDTCVFAVYCSEKCKQDAWTSYHDKECTKYDYYKILKIFMESTTNDFDKFIPMLMLLRRVLIFTIKETNDKSVDHLYSKFFGNGVNQDKRIRGFKVGDRLDGRTLEACGSLVSHSLEKAASSMFIPFACMLGVDVVSIESDSELEMMVHLVTQTMEKMKQNTYAIGLYAGSCVCEIDKYGAEHQGNCLNRRGVMLAPFCSLINHSCVNNADYTIVNGKMVLFANRPIKADEQIFINYGMADLEKKTSERQHFLYMRYHFTCNCEACRENWPVVSEKESYEANDAGFSEFVDNFEKLIIDEKTVSKLVEDLENKLRDRNFNLDIKKFSSDVGIEVVKNENGIVINSEVPPFIMSINRPLLAASKTIHEMFAKNTLRTFVAKSGALQLELKSIILREVLCYNKKHFNISDSCSKK